jgi:hypothetical protein
VEKEPAVAIFNVAPNVSGKFLHFQVVSQFLDRIPVLFLSLENGDASFSRQLEAKQTVR